MFPEKWYYKNNSFWHFNSRFVLKTTKTPVFVIITEIIWWIFWRNKWRSLIDVVERLCYFFSKCSWVKKFVILWICQTLPRVIFFLRLRRVTWSISQLKNLRPNVGQHSLPSPDPASKMWIDRHHKGKPMGAKNDSLKQGCLKIWTEHSI